MKCKICSDKDLNNNVPAQKIKSFQADTHFGRSLGGKGLSIVILFVPFMTIFPNATMWTISNCLGFESAESTFNFVLLHIVQLWENCNCVNWKCSRIAHGIKHFVRCQQRIFTCLVMESREHHNKLRNARSPTKQARSTIEPTRFSTKNHSTRNTACANIATFGFDHPESRCQNEGRVCVKTVCHASQTKNLSTREELKFVQFLDSCCLFNWSAFWIQNSLIFRNVHRTATTTDKNLQDISKKFVPNQFSMNMKETYSRGVGRSVCSRSRFNLFSPICTPTPLISSKKCFLSSLALW